MAEANSMNLYKDISDKSFERIVRCDDPVAGLTAIIAIHDTTLGPALGGTRFYPYTSFEEALADVKRLAEAMTYKNAIAGLPFGGGKAVIIGDPRTDKTLELLKAYGGFLDYLEGRYFTAEDVGTGIEDMAFIRQYSRYARGFPQADGAPHPATAKGVFLGIKAALKHCLGSDDLSNRTVAIQGLGHVGMKTAEYLHAEGAHLKVADIDAGRATEAALRFDGEIIGSGHIHEVAADVFSPCALGGSLNKTTIPQIAAPVVAGSANNQLSTLADSRRLMDRGILYAPDFVINAGGVIDVAMEGLREKEDAIQRKVREIPNTLSRIFKQAQAEHRPTQEIALAMAKRIIVKARQDGHREAG